MPSPVQNGFWFPFPAFPEDDGNKGPQLDFTKSWLEGPTLDPVSDTEGSLMGTTAPKRSKKEMKQ